MKRFSVALLLLTCWAAWGISQTKGGEIRVIGEKVGLLSNRRIDFASNDSRGFTWFGSLQGLSRFDGTELKTILSDSRHGSDSVAWEIQSPLFEDRAGRLWFTTYVGLACYDPAKDVPFHWSLYFQGKRLEEWCQAFYLDQEEQKIWLQAGERLGWVQLPEPGDEPVFQDLGQTAHGFRLVPELEDGKLVRIWSAPWLRDTGLELFSLENDQWIKTKFFNQARDTESDIGILPGGVISVVPQSQHTTWVLTTNGLIKLDPITRKARRFIPEGIQNITFREGKALDFTRLIMISAKQGIWVFNQKVDSFYRFKFKEANNNGLLRENGSWFMHMDSEQRIWVTIPEAGVGFIQEPDLPFQNPLNKIKQGPEVVGIVEDLEGKIMVATRKNGVYSKRPKSGWNLVVNGGLFSDIDLSSIKFSPGGNLLLASRLKLFECRSTSWKEILNLESDNALIDFGETDSGIILTTNNGIRRKRAFQELFPIYELPRHNELVYSKIFHLSKKEIAIVNNESEVQFYKTDEAGDLVLVGSLSLPQSAITMALDSNKSRLYIATNKQLFSYHLQTGKHNLVLSPSIENPVYDIQSLAVDHAGSLWIATQSEGLFSYDPISKELFRYRKPDGVPSESFIRGASLCSSDGRLWFGTKSGLVVFHPDSIKPYPYGPKVYIDHLSAGNLRLEKQGDTLLSSLKNLELKKQYTPFAIQFKSIGYHLPELNTIRYQLSKPGLDDTWEEADAEGFAFFGNLGTGKYTLRFKALNANGIEGPVESINIEITLSFWETVWFKMLMGGIGVLLLVLAVRFRYVRKLHRKEMLLQKERAESQEKLHQQELLIQRARAQNEERNRIGKEIHDDLGALTSVIIFLTGGLLKGETDPDRKAKLNLMAQSSNDLVEKVEEIIWALNAEDDNLEHLSSELRISASEYLTKHDIEIRVDMPDQFPDVELKGEQKRNIYLIVKESLHNIVKHSKGSQVWFSIRMQGEHYHLTIEDNGVGFEVGKTDPRRNGMRNLGERADAIGAVLEIDSKPGAGTTIDIKVPV